MSAKNRAAVTLGRKGGKVKSDAKAKASRKNGKKGGRPKREDAPCVSNLPRGKTDTLTQEGG